MEKLVKWKNQLNTKKWLNGKSQLNEKWLNRKIG